MIRELAHEYWEGTLRAHPFLATLLGDRRYDAETPDLTPAGVEREAARLQNLRDRLEATPATAKDRVTAAMLKEQLDSGLASYRAKLWTWSVDPLGGPQHELMNLGLLQKPGTTEQAEALLARWAKLHQVLDSHTQNLRDALAEGKVATHDATARVVRQLEETLAKPTAEWPLLQPASELPKDWTDGQRQSFSERLRDSVERSIRPAFERYLACIRDEILPRARPQDKVGVCFVEGGEQAYRDAILIHTSLAFAAEQIHEIGLEELRLIRQEMSELGGRALGCADLPTLLDKLQHDKSVYFTTREEVRGYAEESLAKANAAIPRWFGRLPKAACEVRPIEAHEEKDSTLGYYRHPTTDGSRPGTYYINTYAPETRPRFESQVLAFHEAVPGHHLQIAIAMELEDMPEFRKHGGVTAYVEGWALYTERLAEEMGLYNSDLDRIGMLSFDAWRACRLVVDTGLHALGWSRQKAIDFMSENAALTRGNIENEVDRYITWPGQALAYKLGQIEIFNLRREAERRLGPKFDIREFHDRLLENGAVSIPLLHELIRGWIAEREGSPRP